MSKIGIISDSHQRVDIAQSAIKYLKNKDIDILLHAGDIVELDTLKIMQKSQIPYKAVFGNNDTLLKAHKDKFNIHKEPYDFKFKNLNLRLMHYPFYFDSTANIVVYGHTHHFFASLQNGTLYINPGEICARKKPFFEFAYVIYSDSNFKVFYISAHAKNPLKWVEKEIKL